MHFPTDLNLLWDASRKCIQLLRDSFQEESLPGWRKSQHWERRLKVTMRQYWQIKKSGGKNKSERLLKAAKTYLQIAYDLEEKVMCSIQKLRAAHIPLQVRKQDQLDYFHTMLIRHIDLIERRLINGETIPQQDKCVSLFEPYTQ